MTAEHLRLDAARRQSFPWKEWGAYLSERQWGTVREGYREGGDAWGDFTHDQARSRAYRWGEDGLAEISDDKQRLCLAPALWNGKAPILEERLFGLTSGGGNHGEDVKEYSSYLDDTPTHSYMRYLGKYPQCAFRYADLVETNRKRGRQDSEYERPVPWTGISSPAPAGGPFLRGGPGHLRRPERCRCGPERPRAAGRALRGSTTLRSLPGAHTDLLSGIEGARS
jgi:hypothetical protein